MIKPRIWEKKEGKYAKTLFFPSSRYAEKFFTQIHTKRYVWGRYINMVAGNQQKYLSLIFCYKSVNLSLEELKKH